jgi:hypothetical protein
MLRLRWNFAFAKFHPRSAAQSWEGRRSICHNRCTDDKAVLQNEKATRQLGSLFSQGRIVPTEVLSIRTFCGNLMSLKSTVSSKICDLNTLIFNNLHNMSTSRQTGSKWAKRPCF